jgi:hypothetical protein
LSHLGDVLSLSSLQGRQRSGPKHVLEGYRGLAAAMDIVVLILETAWWWRWMV